MINPPWLTSDLTVLATFSSGDHGITSNLGNSAGVFGWPSAMRGKLRTGLDAGDVAFTWQFVKAITRSHVVGTHRHVFSSRFLLFLL